MSRSIVTVLSVLIFVSLGALAEEINFDEVNYNYCMKQLKTGNYKSAGDQLFCERFFDLPSAYLIKCLNFEINEYPTDLDQQACGLFFESNKNWGPWEDYQLTAEQEEMKSIVMKRFSISESL